MLTSEKVDVRLQEKVPEHILRIDDDFSSDSDDDGKESDRSEDIEDMEVDHGEEFESKGNSGWADAMAKILKTNAPKGKKSIVLAKAKKISDVLKQKKIPDLGFEIEGAIKDEKTDVDSFKKEIDEQKQNEKLKQLARLKRKEWSLKGRVKPSVLEKNRERTLAKVATKGVVQLFNAVRNHQKNISRKLNEAGSERRREKVLKSVDKKAFLDMLMGSTATKRQTEESVKTEVKEEDQSPWNVLRDDFMMGGNLKDWDKKMESSIASTDFKEEEEVDNTKDEEDSGDEVVGAKGNHSNSDDDSDDEVRVEGNDSDSDGDDMDASSDNSSDSESDGDS